MKHLIEYFKKHVAERPNDIFCIAGDKRITFAEADRLTETLDPQYVTRCGDKVAAFIVPRNELMVLVPLAIAKAGLTAMPLDGSYPEERLNYMREDAAKYDGDEAFVLLYTSGTTGIPKGVMLSEANILAFLDFHVQAIGLTPQSKYATYAGYGFDAFQMDLWCCVKAGATICIVGDEIRFDLEGLNQYIQDEHITHCFMTTQMATQLVLNYPDIPGLEWLGTGGEKLISLDPPSYKLMNCYGPTECTVYVSSFFVTQNEPNIPIGKANTNGTQLIVVGQDGKEAPTGTDGELYVAGPQVSLGYLNQPEKTAEVFVEWNGLRCYKTGDIVHYREDGNIEFVGRRDGQVKIRGFRIELKEVEAIIREFPGIKDATVQAFDYPDGGKFIAAYVVSDETINIDELNTFIGDSKPPYMVPAVTMQIDAIPLNPNQKVDKRALPKPEPKAVSDQPSEISAAPLNVLEQELHDIIAKIVNMEEFGITTDLRYMGLSSIAAIKLATQIFKRFGVQLDAKEMTKGITLQAIENEILAAMLGGHRDTEISKSPISNVQSQMSEAPLSFAQLGVYFECMKNPTSTLYNVPICTQMPLEVETEALRQAVRKAVLNHSELFVHFATQEADVIQTIDEKMMNEVHIDVPEKALEEAQMDAFKHEFVQPFNLQKDLLFRFFIVRTEKNLYLLSDIHHLVCDGASYDLFIHEICDLLEGKEIEPEMCSYPQFVAEQKAAENGESFKAAKDFFAERLTGIESVTEIQPDLTNALPQGENGRVCVPFDMQTAEKYAAQLGVTPAAVLLSAVYYSLARFAGTDDVCITTISNGRSNLRVNNTMGMFVNTLALTTKIANQTVEEFVKENAQSFEQTLAHEDYPFARVAADYDLKAEIMFAYQMGVLSNYSVFGKPVFADETMEQNVPKFKIAFYIMPMDGVPSIAVEYDNGWYSEALITNLAQSVANAVLAFAANTNASLRAISLLNEAQTAVLDSFNETEVPYDDTQTIVSLFRQQAAETPDNLAVVYHDVRLTYKEVDERTDAIAAKIYEMVHGTCPNGKSEQVVSILINRSEWMVVASLAALKAGCAYQPLDPSYPAERLNFMMKDANASLLIADEDLRPIVNEYEGPVLLTKELESSALSCQPSAFREIDPSDLFILLYTSGSTGVPKGCQLEHRNLVAFCHWYHRYYDLHAGDKVAAYASYGFDANMMDMYPALTCGAAVYIIGEDIRLNLPDLNHYFEAEGITHSFMTTQVGYQFAQNCDNHSLKHLSVGGEKLATIAPPANYLLHNAYGPTECTIFTTTYPIHEQEKNIPIGKPLDNFRLFIVDKDLHRVPVGATGELLVCGPQVSRGYLNRPDKTAETYIDWDGLRCYRTGDVVRYLEDGNIQFVGRQDGQVKIRGFRIELKEVEAVIREYPGINDATVQAFDYPNGGKFIAAYIVSDSKIDIQALNAFIRDRKPPYMVPASIMQIDVIPLNQNQKVNKRALPAPQLTDTDRDYVAPANDNEKLFCDIFASILNQDKIGATDNFFELGGTSLMVTRVIIEADKAGKHVAYGDIFTHPTPRLLAQFLSGDTDEQTANDQEEAAFDYTGIDAILQRNNLNTFLRGERQELGNVLLTGATGYLGIHVLRELIDSDAKTITCLVRGKDQHDAQRRLRNLLFYYFDRRFDELFGSRLFVVNGDVTSDISDQLSAFLAYKRHDYLSIQTVFNCAANVKHFSKTDDIEQVNIGGAERCVEFCLKTGARLVHISTTSVGEIWVDRGDGKAVPELSERVLYFGQFLDNRYMRSKFLAERVILEAVARHGLNAKVMRVGNLAARSYDGEFQANFQTNSYMGRLKVFSTLGCCPIDEYDSPAEFSPVNETAKAVVLLASTPKECNVFQPFNNHTDLLGDILAGFEKIGKSIRYVEEDEFQQAILEASKDPKKASLMSALLAYQDMTHGQKAVTIERDNRYTSAVLLRLGFHWSAPDSAYVNRMLTAISQLGFFDV
jgi:amino acid adenylation domain-containing protein/thioester reductase-like protein